MTNKVLKIKIRDDKGEFIEKEVSYDATNISLDDIEEISKLSDQERYIEYDEKKMAEEVVRAKRQGKDIDEEELVLTAITKMDGVGLREAQEKAWKLLTKICFNIKEYKDKDISGLSFLELVKYVKEKDPLSLGKKQQEQKEKIEKVKEKKKQNG